MAFVNAITKTDLYSDDQLNEYGSSWRKNSSEKRPQSGSIRQKLCGQTATDALETTTKWLIVIVGSALTVFMCIALIEQYKSGSTSMSLALQRNETMTYPRDPLFCLNLRNFSSVPFWYAQIYDVKLWDLIVKYPTPNDFLTYWQYGKSDFQPSPVPITPYYSWGTYAWGWHLIKAIDMYLKYPTLAGFSEGIDSLAVNLTEGIIAKFGVTKEELGGRLAQELAIEEAKFRNKTLPYEAYIKSYFSSGKSNTSLLTKSNGYVYPSIMYLSLACLHYTALFELGSGEFFAAVDNKTIMLGEEFSACLLLEENLRALNISTDQFRQRLGQEIADGFSFGVCPPYTELSTMTSVTFMCLANNLLRSSVVTSLNYMEVCYRVPMGNLSAFESPTRNFWFSASMNLWAYPPAPFSMKLLDRFNQFQPDQNFVAMDLSGRDRYVFGDANCWLTPSLCIGYASGLTQAQEKAIRATDSTMVVKSMMGRQLFATTRFSQYYRFIPEINGETRCSTSGSVYDCIRNCKVDFVWENLHCIPSSLVRLNASTVDQECRLADLYAWRNSSTNFPALTACVGNCLNDCEDWRIEFDATPMSYFWLGDVGISMRVSTFQYALYVEEMAMSGSAFAGNLGGLLGLWLGIDLFVVSQLLLAPILLIASRRSNQIDTAAAKDDAISMEKTKRQKAVDDLQKQVTSLEQSIKQNRLKSAAVTDTLQALALEMERKMPKEVVRKRPSWK